MVTGTGRCPLCDADGAEVLLRIGYEDVWSRLERDWGVVLSAEVRAISAPSPTATLVRCTSCGLERFEPLLPGGPGFYAELMAAIPYAEERWDLSMTRRAIGPGDDVVDLGCGEGRFLAALGERSGRTVGVDHHEPAIRKIVSRGGEGYACSFEEFARREVAAFDVATSFHTLEHLADPLSVVRSAARCLRPGGRMFISTPNRQRAWREEGEPLDRPPHHVTRWAPDQLVRLADGIDLSVVEVHLEPLDVSVVRAARARSWRAQLPGGGGRVGDLAMRVLARMLIRPGAHMRAVARGTYASLHGHSMLVELRRA
jgi:SAM-dependent methyltransferase